MADSSYAAVEDCEELKGVNQTKGLYGLCLAFWRADESQQQRFLDKYNAIRDDLEGPPMPGLSDFGCPCWDHLTLNDVILDDPFPVCFNFPKLPLVFARFDDGAGYTQLFGADDVLCRFRDEDLDGSSVFEPRVKTDLSPETATQCRDEIKAFCGVSE
ncbi:MAG: hypothetical protein V3R51_01625 [Gammaproteobacteria bacterium]